MTVKVGVLRYQAPEEVLQKVREAFVGQEVEFEPFAPTSAEEARDQINEQGYDITLLRPYTLIEHALREGKRFIFVDEDDGQLKEIKAVPIDAKPFNP